MLEGSEMATPMPFKDNQNRKNAHGVTAPVRPRITATASSFDARLKRVTTKHKKAIESLAKR